MKKYGSEFTNFQINRSRLRRIVRKLYFQNILKFIKGRTIDFGCGVGDLLSLLPNGSIGFEINPVSVQHCQERGLDVFLFDPDKDRYEFSSLEHKKFKTFVTSHVLEHLDDPGKVFKKIQKSCKTIGIEKIVVVVPGYKGFYCDEFAGHKNYIEKDFFTKNIDSDYVVKSKKFFPINSATFGKLFQHNELVVVLERANK